MYFVTATRIEPFLEAIKDRPEFIHVVKDGYQVIDYMFEDGDSFYNDYRLECRGIKFDLDGNIIARPLHKFFNYGQKEILFDWKGRYRIMTKMDGSMIHTAIINDELRLCTRMGITDQSIMAEKWLQENQDREVFSLLKQYCKENNATVIFEFTSLANRIVIEYDKPQLTLLNVRDNFTGVYLPNEDVEELAFHLGLPKVEEHEMTLGDDNIAKIREKTTGIEGYVVAWDDGAMTKIKTDEYCQMHRAVSYFERENMILPIVLDSQCDDLYPALAPDRADKLFTYEAAVMKEFLAWVQEVDTRVVAFNSSDQSRKDFALNINEVYPKGIRAAFFSSLDGKKSVKESVKACIIRNPDLLETRWVL